MTNDLPLILAVADLAYSGGEFFELLRLSLEKSSFPANLQLVPLIEVIQTVQHQRPALIIIGHRPLLDNDAMRKRWEIAGKIMGGDIVKALKSTQDTQDIPVLLLEGLVDIERVAHECGADAHLKMPVRQADLVETIKRLMQNESQRLDSSG